MERNRRALLQRPGPARAGRRVPAHGRGRDLLALRQRRPPPNLACRAAAAPRFLDVLQWYDKHGVAPPLRHMANSGAILQLRESHLDLVRPASCSTASIPPPRSAARSPCARRWRGVARRLLQGGDARPPGELWLDLAVRSPGAHGHCAGGLRRRLLRALSNVARVIIAKEVSGGRARLHGSDHGQHRVGDRLQRRRGGAARAAGDETITCEDVAAGPNDSLRGAGPTSTPASPACMSRERHGSAGRSPGCNVWAGCTAA